MLVPPADKPNYGICYVLKIAYESGNITAGQKHDLQEEMHAYLKRRGWHSGSDNFPIAGYATDLDCVTLFTLGNLWNPDTEYGRRRIETLKHLREYYCETL